MAKQAVYFSGKESGAAVDVRNQTGKTGPSADYPDLLLSTTVFWWGQANDQSSRTIQYVDGAGIVLTGQEQEAGSYYPFCSMPVSHSTVHLDKAQMDHLSMGDRTIRSITLNYLDPEGTAVKKETMRWQMMNALNMPKAGESGDLMDSMDALRDIMRTEGGMSNVGSDFLAVGLKLATSAKIESDFLTLRLAPTQDPTVFRGLVYVGLGTEGEGVSGAGGYEGNLLDTMNPDDSSYELNYTILFISYSTVLWSAGFEKKLGTSSNWKNIEDYWQEVGAGKSGAGGIIVPQGARMVAYDAATGTALLSAEQEAVLADRDYLGQYDRSYDSSGPSLPGGSSRFRRIASRTDKQIVETLGNSYSLASPVLSEDGGWLFYLDDMGNPSDATVVRVKAAQRSGTGYDVTNSVALSNDGYGDSGLKAAGSENSAVAVWSRVTEQPAITEPGQAITPDVQAGMLNSSDIMVAVRGGSGWTVKNLTENNGVADLSPVVATNGTRILVAWRQVASTNATDLTNFDAKDYIYYSVSEDNGLKWTTPAPLYNGTSGSVKGLEAAMLDNGKAAVVFTLQNGEPSNGAYHQEIAYAIVDKNNSNSYEVSRYVQVTNDTNLDENPQVAAVKLNDNTDAFILGWHCLSGDGSDIRLAAIGSDGSRITGFVDSLGSMMQNTDVTVSPNFQFGKNAKKLEDLSILWAETDTDGGQDGKAPSHDFLSALRFRVEDDNRISVTSAQRLVEMGEYTAIDSFNAYVGDDKNLYAAIQGTCYDYNKPESIQVGGTTVQVASDKTSIFTTTGAYTDTLRIDSVIPDYANIRKGTALPVQFSVTNLGTQPLTKVEVAIDSETTTFQEGPDSAFVAIGPGDTRVLTVFYTVPSTGAIPNPEYTVTGTFKDGKTYAPEKETMTLDIPDLGIADSGILLDAVDGDRILQFNLYNLSDAELAGSNRTVHFNLYSDAACTNEIAPEYLTLVQSGSGRSGGALLSVGGSDLAAIDEGSYTLRYKFDLESYIKQGTSEFKDSAGEVRDGGVTLYAKAWIELPAPDGGEMLEYNSSNNVTDIHFESLLKQADGAPTTVTRVLDNSGEGSKVTVTLQNNSMNICLASSALIFLMLMYSMRLLYHTLLRIPRIIF